MRRVLSLLGLFTLLLAGTSQAAGVNLRWNACYGDGGSANRTSACTSNFGSAGTMVGSFELASDITGVTGVEITAQVTSADASLPAWWQFNAPGGVVGCRGFALSVNPSISGSAVNCTDWAGGVALGGLASYRVGFSGANTARILMGFAVQTPVDIAKDIEIFTVNMVVFNSKTTGAGSCAGCTTPACIAINSINIVPGIEPSVLLTASAHENNSNVVAWQGGIPTTCAAMDTPSFTVATAVLGRGTISRSPNWSRYSLGTPLTLAATPLPGDRFVAWSGDTTSTSSTVTTSVTRNLVYYATFERDPAAAATLVSTRDFPADQGSCVWVDWDRSPLDDVAFSGTLCCYRIERTLDSSPTSPWVAASGSIAASQSLHYSQVVITSSDSTASDPAIRRYRVVAVAIGTPGEWISNDLPGYSVDNIAPPPPGSVTGAFASGTVSLSWPAVSVADLHHYAVYRATEGVPPTDAAHLVATTTGTDYNDSPGYFARYAVTAVDRHGNQSAGTVFTPLNTTDAPGRPPPRTLTFGSPFPSPMSHSMSLSIGLPHAMTVSVDVLDSQGRFVRQLASGEHGAGWLTLSWDARDTRGRDAAAGVYFVRVQTPEGRSVKRLVRIP